MTHDINNVTVAAKGTPTDPGAQSTGFWSQWHLTGQYGLNLLSVWDDYTGDGVRVGILDDGFDYTHSELSNNFRTDLDYDVLGNDYNSINDSNDTHGTYVSLVIGADDNGSRDVGIAFDADLVGIRRGFNGEGTTQDTVDAFEYALANNFDIINNSWSAGSSFGDNTKVNFSGTDTSAVTDAFEDLVELGRNGLGANIVFAAGNDRTDGQGANDKNFQNSPYSITVAATDENGNYAYFSEAGANILVAAPGQSVLTSSASDNGAAVYLSGTSFSAPAVSGVIALMLEANSQLGYRDVQEILALSARQTDINGTGWANEGWQYNGATNVNGSGLHFSHDYGFGLVDALAAVRLAESWHITGNTSQTYTNMTTLPPVSGSSLSLPATGTVSTSMNITQDISIEHILIDIDLSHGRAGDLKVTLIAPSGTQSVLMYNVENGAYTSSYGTVGVDFEFSSVAHWGESSQGQWTLQFEDTTSGNSGTLNNWSLSFLGSAQSSDDTYYFTNDYALSNATIVDDINGGADTINMAAFTGNIDVDLITGNADLGGNSLQITNANTTIENIITGDGADQITTNALDNIVHTGRGNDVINASLGSDIIDGGLGSDILSFANNITNYNR